MRKTVLAVAVLIVAPLLAQDRSTTPQFYESGNAFLHSCDDSGVSMQSQSMQVRETASLVCTMWVVGVVQGMGLKISCGLSTKIRQPSGRTTKPSIRF